MQVLRNFFEFFTRLIQNMHNREKRRAGPVEKERGNMRLVCPNCDAQYEVDDSVIPEGGRDVQCSNCGSTWFQKSAAQLADEENPPPAPLPKVESTAAPAPEPDPEPAEQAAGDDPAPEALEEPAPQDEPAEDVAAAETPQPPEADPEADPTPAEPEAEPDPAPQRRALDEDVANVLREEAALEAEARQTASAPLESQPDLGLDDAGDRAEGGGLKERIARLRGVSPESFERDDAPRRELLPDIEEINSTLRASSDRVGDEVSSASAAAAAAAAGAAPVRRRSRFGTGFGLMLLVAVLLVVLYSFAPLLIAKVPALAPALTAFVEFADSARVSVNRIVSSGTEQLTAFLNGLSGE